MFRITLLLATIGLAGCASTPTVGVSHHPELAGKAAGDSDLAELRRATAAYQDFARAGSAGYAERITPCWENRTQGGMGYHYAKPDLLDGTVSLLEPEALVYEPQPGGKMRLVGVEYIVPIEAWSGDAAPMLLGEQFHPHSTLPIYKLHVWLWQDNPRGIFADWNPTVSCKHAAETEMFG